MATSLGNSALFVISVACFVKLFLLPFYAIFGTDQAAPTEEFSQLCIGQLILWRTRDTQ